MDLGFLRVVRVMRLLRLVRLCKRLAYSPIRRSVSSYPRIGADITEAKSPGLASSVRFETGMPCATRLRAPSPCLVCH